MDVDHVGEFLRLRPLLFSIAYGMTGSVADAEDIVSEVFLRLDRVVDDGTVIRSPKAYLTTAVTRMALDQLSSARARRERYVGPWLPEPLLDAGGHDEVADQVETADSLSMALLVVLETLSPAERAAFLLREVFDYDYAEIAAIIGKNEPNCRQLVSRARSRVAEKKPRFEASAAERDRLAGRFFAAIERGDLDGLVDLLAADVVAYGDGGGRAPSLPRPIYGREKVARLLTGLTTALRALQLRLEPVPVNGQPGAAVRDREGRLVTVLSLDIADGQVQTVRSIINPDKLQHLAPLAPTDQLRLRS